MGGDRTLLGIRFILLRSFASYWNRCGCGGLSGIAQGPPLEEVGRKQHREVQQNIQ